jgi:hypothetical protein
MGDDGVFEVGRVLRPHDPARLVAGEHAPGIHQRDACAQSHKAKRLRAGAAKA